MANKNKKPAIRFKGFTEDWEGIRIGDFTEMFSGGTPLVGITEYYNGDIPFIRSGEINCKNTALFISEAGLKNSSAKMVEKGVILYALYGATSGMVAISKIQGAINQAILAIKPNKGYDSELLMHWLRNEKNRIVSTFIQGGQGNLSSGIVKDLYIKLPNPTEQKKIGTFFQNLDNLITQHQKKHNKLVILKKAMLDKMFPKNGAKVPEIRFKGFTGDWEEKELGNIGNPYTGLSGKTKVDFGHGNARYITYMNVFSNPVADTKLIEPIEIDNTQNTVLKGDVLFSVSSETADEVGMSSVWISDLQNIYLNSFCFGYRPNIKIHSYFLANLLRSSTFRKNISFLAQGISRFNISKNKVMEISISLPKYDEQQKIGDYFKNLDNQIALHQTQLDKLKNIKKACLSKMFVA